MRRTWPPPVFSESQSTTRTVIGRAAPDLANWWTVFNDPTLHRLIDRALRSNLDLQTAESRVREARAQVKAARSAELPTINASGNAVTVNSDRKSSSAAAGAAAGGAIAAAGGFQLPSHTHP